MGRIYIPKNIRKQVFERANFLCEYCFSLDAYSSSPFVIEHIIPVTKEGTNDLGNLALACHGCNLHKYNKVFGLDEVSQVLVALYNPRKEDWLDHFRWNKDHSIIIGRTDTGRATVGTLHLNRTRLINQRLLFKAVGLHPPSFTLI